MRAAHLINHIGPDGVQIVDTAEPGASEGKVVVDIHAAGVSFPDLLQTRAGYQLVRPLPAVLGLEGAGVVRHAPRGCALTPGQRVAVFSDAGTWQQTVAVEPASVFPLPDELSMTAAAGMLLNFLTVHFALTNRSQPPPGGIILVHGAAGGIGTAALRIAPALGLDTIAVVSTSAKATAARGHGATHVVDAADFKNRTLDITDGSGVDVALDPVGGDRFLDTLRSLAVGGQAVILGFTAGEIPSVKVNRLLLKNISVTGAGWAEYIRVRPSYPQEQWSDIAAMVRSGRLKVPEPATVSLDHAALALRALDDRTAHGKSVLTLR